MLMAVIWRVLTQGIGDLLSVWCGSTNTKNFNFNFLQLAIFILYYFTLLFRSKILAEIMYL